MEKVKQQVEQSFVTSGEHDRIQELLKQRLMECGWADHLKVRVNDLIQQRNGVKYVTPDSLAQDLHPYARASVPEPVKAEILSEIMKFVSGQIEN